MLSSRHPIPHPSLLNHVMSHEPYTLASRAPPCKPRTLIYRSKELSLHETSQSCRRFKSKPDRIPQSKAGAFCDKVNDVRSDYRM